MQFTVSMLSLASLGINILSVQSAALPASDLARRAEESVNHVYLSDKNERQHVYSVDKDEIASNEKRHVYSVDKDEVSPNEKRHPKNAALTPAPNDSSSTKNTTILCSLRDMSINKHFKLKGLTSVSRLSCLGCVKPALRIMCMP